VLRLNEPQVFSKLINNLTNDDVVFLVIFMNKNLIKRLKYLNLSGKISKQINLKFLFKKMRIVCFQLYDGYSNI
jgi:hypothetical protein